MNQQQNENRYFLYLKHRPQGQNFMTWRKKVTSNLDYDNVRENEEIEWKREKFETKLYIGERGKGKMCVIVTQGIQTVIHNDRMKEGRRKRGKVDLSSSLEMTSKPQGTRKKDTQNEWGMGTREARNTEGANDEPGKPNPYFTRP